MCSKLSNRKHFASLESNNEMFSDCSIAINGQLWSNGSLCNFLGESYRQKSTTTIRNIILSVVLWCWDLLKFIEVRWEQEELWCFESEKEWRYQLTFRIIDSQERFIKWISYHWVWDRLINRQSVRVKVCRDRWGKRSLVHLLAVEKEKDCKKRARKVALSERHSRGSSSL